MKTLTLFLLIFTLGSSLLSTTLQAQPLYIGTNADGIYHSHFNPETGTLTTPTLAAEYTRPSFLTSHPEKPILYATAAGDNTIAAYSISQQNTLTLIHKIESKGTNPCHLDIDSTARTIALANYANGTLTTIHLDTHGKPLSQASIIKIEGSSIHPQRQRSSHVHGVYFDKTNKFLLCPDLGTDKILVYKLNPTTSTLTPNSPPHFSTAPGSGPRHLTFSLDQKHIYINNELNNTITATTFNKETGALTEIQTISTLPAGYTGKNSTAEIEIHPSGNFLYCSNRGHNTIAVFSSNPQTGKLTHLQHAPCGGEIPRHFKIHPSGKWLLCAHQKSNTISTLTLDPTTGLLGTPENTVKSPAPTCLLFK